MTKNNKRDKKFSHRKAPAMLNQHGGVHKARRNELREKAIKEDLEEEIKALNEDDDEFEDLLDDPKLPDLEN